MSKPVDGEDVIRCPMFVLTMSCFDGFQKGMIANGDSATCD
jgi:hypothetical protein